MDGVTHYPSVQVKKVLPLIPHSYCPIAVLSTMAMVLERVIHSQFYNHILPFIPSSTPNSAGLKYALTS